MTWLTTLSGGSDTGTGFSLWRAEKMVVLRVDVDYPYASRLKSIITMLTGVRFKNYMSNAKELATMIALSRNVEKAYWCFTTKNPPDKELLDMLKQDKVNEIALHIVKNPHKELEELEKTTGEKIKHYSIHGIQSPTAKIIWQSKGLTWSSIQENFPAKPIHPAYPLDRICRKHPPEVACRLAFNSLYEILYGSPQCFFHVYLRLVS